MANPANLVGAFGMAAVESDEGGFIGVKRRSRMVKYWKMCERKDCQIHTSRKGWVVVGPSMRSSPYDHAIFVSVKHMTELPDSYGLEYVGAGPMTEVTGTGTGRYYTIVANGGLKEFPADQIVALGWHKIPELYNALAPDVRTQVDVLTSRKYTCEFGCFENGAPKEFYTEELLARHIKANHKEATMASAVGKAVKAGQQAVDPQMIAHVVAAALAEYERQSYTKTTSRRRTAENDE